MFINNNMRLSGLASGMDTESMVKKLMQAERMPLNKLKQQRQLEEWKRDSYREINSMVRELRDLSSSMRLQGSYIKSTANVTDSTVLTVSSSAPVETGNYKITVAPPTHTNPLNIESLEAFNQTNQALDLSGTITIEGKGGAKVNILLDKTDSTKNLSINDIITQINAKSSDTLVSASLVDGKLVLSSTDTGTDSQIKLSGSAEIWSALNLKGNEVSRGTTTWQVTLKGTSPSLNTIEETVTTTSNNVSIKGLNINVLQAGTTDVQVTRSTQEAAFDSIVKFVNKYNEIIDKINFKLTERKFRDFKPLTDEQKEELSEKQIEKWEEKAKSGLLQGDPMLSSILTQLRQDWSANVSGLSGDMDNMFKLGLSTGTYEQRGKILIDEQKLRDALSNNPEGVMNLFTSRSTPDDYSSRGIATRLYDNLSTSITKIIDKAGSSTGFSRVDNSSIGKVMKGIDQRIESFERRLTQVETRYWKQFNAMEKAIQRSNAQSSWLMQQMGGGM